MNLDDLGITAGTSDSYHFLWMHAAMKKDLTNLRKDQDVVIRVDIVAAIDVSWVSTTPA